MKKLTVIAAVAAALAFAQTANAQTNVQGFYDFDRECFTSTIEMFKGDEYGNTFFFIDYDYQLHPINGTVTSPGSTYFEFARCINLWQDSPIGAFSAHVEYNGGFGTIGYTPGGRNSNFYGVNHAVLVGVDYFAHSADFNNTLNLKVLYKKFMKLDQQVPLQFTAVWGMQDLFGVKGLRFSGFADVWWESKCVFLSEPQLWYALGEHFNVGGEVELSSNFAGYDGFACRPCVGFKWNF